MRKAGRKLPAFFASKKETGWEKPCVTRPRRYSSRLETGDEDLLKGVMGRIKCLFGKHLRSHGRAHKLPGTENFVSVCGYCGIAMEKFGKGGTWQVRRPSKQRTR